MDLFNRSRNKKPGKVLCTFHSEYGEFVIRNGLYRGVPARLYEVNGTRESATFFDENKYELVFDYARAFCRLIDMAPGAEKFLMFGGAGFQFPKYLIGHYPYKKMDVVEINPLAVDIARKYFYLNDLEKDFQAESTGRLRIFIGDGMNYLAQTDEKYDCIINDAYHSDIPDKGLTSPKGISLIKDHLNPGGLYGFNLITSLKGEGSMPLFLTERNLKYQFDDVHYFRCSPDVRLESTQNVLFISKQC